MVPMRPVLLALSTLLAIAACGRSPTLDGAPVSSLAISDIAAVTLTVSRILAPTDAAAGELVTATVEAVLPNGCTRLDTVNVDVDDGAGIVTFDARGWENRSAYCIQAGAYGAQSLTYRSQVVTFVPARSGAYRLQGTRGQATVTLRVR